MSEGLVQAAYIIAALLFIMSLAGLSKHETAKAGCWCLPPRLPQRLMHQ